VAGAVVVDISFDIVIVHKLKKHSARQEYEHPVRIIFIKYAHEYHSNVKCVELNKCGTWCRYCKQCLMFKSLRNTSLLNRVPCVPYVSSCYACPICAP